MFGFCDPGRLCSGELLLVLAATQPGQPQRGMVPTYQFNMIDDMRKRTVGKIELRVGSTPAILFETGHIGYTVFPTYRGLHYAARSCRLLIPLARRHGLCPLWITCDPANLASRRTCELAGAQLVEIVDLPASDDRYHKDARQKCRYRLEI